MNMNFQGSLKPARRADQRERSERDKKFIQITRNMYLSDAYRSLSPNAARLWNEFLFRYSGNNNGDIGFSVREATLVLKGDRKETPSLSTAKKALDELIAKGFILIAKDSSFNMKQAKSRRWTLTNWPLRAGQAPTNEWLSWRPTHSELGSPDRTNASVEETNAT